MSSIHPIRSHQSTGDDRGKHTDLGFDIVDGVRGLDLEGNGLAREGLDEDLHFWAINYNSAKKKCF